MMLILLFCIGMAMADDTENLVLTKSNHKFTDKMFAKILAEQPSTKSLVMSSFSLMPPLALLALGAVGESQKEIMNVIHFPEENTTKTLAKAFTTTIKNLKSVERATIKLANKIYIANGIQFNELFSTIATVAFDAEVENINFAETVKAADKINNWVEEHTNHLVKDLVSPGMISGSTRTVLVNAIYFQSNWSKQFAPESTTDNDFHVSKTKSIKLPLMFKILEVKFGENMDLDAKLIELPYEAANTSMHIILPNKVDGINDLIEKIKDEDVINEAFKKTNLEYTAVSIPKFKIETQIDLIPILTSMGVKRIFTPGEANLTNLIKGTSDVSISGAIQKAVISVTESGTEAGASTALITLGVHKIQLKEFTADRPFYFEIRVNNLRLFNGIFRGQ